MRTRFASHAVARAAILTGVAVAMAMAAPAPAWAAPPDPPPSFAAEDGAPDVVSGELAVDLRDDVTDADVRDLDARFGVALRPSSAWSASHEKLDVVDVDPAAEEGLASALARDPRVEHVEPMGVYRASFVPNDPLYAPKQWHLRRVGAEKAWDYACGQGITVAVIDTGVACFDEGPFSRGTDLGGTRCDGGWNFVDDDASPADDHGHGTHVAGTIAQTTDNGMGTAGLAFCARLMPIKVLSKQGWGSTANVADGIRWAADHGAQVINLSLGGPIKSRILEDAVDHALGKGVVVVAAAGNSGRSVGYPAAYPGVVAVSATDDQDRIAWFSSRGPEVTLGAPGVAVTQQTVCNGGTNHCEVFGTYNGTSMASPHVAGVAAMIESLGVTDGAAVRDALTSTARTGQQGDDPKLFGAGILDAGAAAAHVFWSHLAVRGLALLGLAMLVARRIRQRGGRIARGPTTIVGALLAGVGLVPVLPLLGLGRAVGHLHTLAELARRPLGEWDLVLGGAGLHQWWLLASALPALALTGIAFGSRRVRPLVGGVALGTAALLVQLAWSGDSAFVLGATLGRVWAVANAALCLWIARFALDRKDA